MSDEDSHEAIIARGAGFVLLGTVFSMGVGFVIRTALIRSFGPSEYGLIALGLTIATVLSIFTKLGLRQGVARSIPQSETETAARDISLTALVSGIIASTMASGVLVAFDDVIAVVVFEERALVPFIQLSALLIPGLTVQALTIAVFRGKKQVQERIVVRNFVSPISRILLVGAAILLGYGAIEAMAGWVTGVVFSAVVGSYYIYSQTNFFKLETFTPQYHSLLVFSLPLMMSSALRTAFQQTDNLLLGYFESAFEVGIYDGAFLLAEVLLVVLSAFGFLFMPVFSELHASGKKQQMQSVYHSVTEWASLLVLPAFVSILLVPESILVTLFKTEYAAAAVPMAVVSTGFFVHVLSGLSGDALIALGDTRRVMLGNATAAVSNLVFNLLLIPRFGILGAAIASAGSYAVFNLVFLYWLHSRTGILPFSLSLLRPLLFSSLVIAGLWFVVDAVFGLTVVTIVATLAIGYVLHLAIVVRLKNLTAGDEKLLSRVNEKTGFDIAAWFE